MQPCTVEGLLCKLVDAVGGEGCCDGCTDDPDGDAGHCLDGSSIQAFNIKRISCWAEGLANTQFWEHRAGHSAWAPAVFSQLK